MFCTGHWETSTRVSGTRQLLVNYAQCLTFRCHTDSLCRMSSKSASPHWKGEQLLLQLPAASPRSSWRSRPLPRPATTSSLRERIAIILGTMELYSPCIVFRSDHICTVE